MAKHRNREEVVNTQLAILLTRYGVKANAETIHLHGLHRPDVLFQMRGLRIVIEGKFADNPAAKAVVLDDARRRVRSGLAHIAAAVVYPIALRTAATDDVLETLASSKLCIKIIAEAQEGEDWFEGTPGALMDALRRAQEGLVKDDIVAQTAASLSERIEGVAHLWAGQTGACDRLSTLLGITAPKGEKPLDAANRRDTVSKVSALVLANAFIFQEQLSASDERIDSLSKTQKQKDILGTAQKHWQWIWENINYVPIFQLGERVLLELPSNPNSTSAVRALLSEAKSICENQAALRHDLMGRIYHWLLHTAKYLGTYYTSVPAATLLMKLTLAQEWATDFGSARDLADFKVGDLACGTGTLLMAAAQAFNDRYIKERVASETKTVTEKDLSTLHSTLMQNVLHGYDVLPSALHLTASTLALLAPEVAFRSMNLYVMPLGIDHGRPRLGSLDFIHTNRLKTQIALDHSQMEMFRTGASRHDYANAEVPPLDICIMNPPFVRSVGGNLLFGSYPDERGLLQKELKEQIKLANISASATAGLGSVFVALADRRIKAGGRLAFILPAALVSGEAWGPTRKLIADRYHLEIVIISHDPKRPNFSENTSLSEVLFIARRLGSGEKSGATKYVNLWRNPRSVHEALDIASRVEAISIVKSVADKGITSIRGLSAKIGEIVTLPAGKGEDAWLGSLFAQTDVLRAAWHLNKCQLRLPHATGTTEMPLCPLGSLGSLGPDRKRIHEGFTVSEGEWSQYPGYWDHKSKKVRTIKQKPNSYLHVWYESPRGPDYGPHLWQRSGKVLLAERIRSTNHRLLAIGLDVNALGNTWWALDASLLNKEQIKALLLWINSSLGILAFYSRRVITEGVFVGMKQPGWQAMPVLDVRALTPLQLTYFAAAYDNICEKELQPLSKLNLDSTRNDIDDAISKVLKLPDLSSLRDLLAHEPGLTEYDLAARPAQTELLPHDDAVEDDQIAFAM